MRLFSSPNNEHKNDFFYFYSFLDPPEVWVCWCVLFFVCVLLCFALFLLCENLQRIERFFIKQTNNKQKQQTKTKAFLIGLGEEGIEPSSRCIEFVFLRRNTMRETPEG